MKHTHLSLLLTAALLSLTTAARSQKRLVLVEEFTNTGCGPCATWSPVLDSCIHYRLGDCIAIKYHSGYPLATDEFYLAEREAMQARVDYYGVTGVPDTYINGMSLGTRSFERLSDAITYCQKTQPDSYTLAVTRQLDGRTLSAEVQLQEGDTDAPERDLRLYVVVVEEHIERTTAWPNGETEVNYTMRKMFEGRKVEWDVDIDADLGQLGVVAFLQDFDTREVLATAYAGPDPKGETSLELLSLSSTPEYICLANYFGEVIFRNDGANVVTSATLNVSVNGTVKQYPWTGKLDHLERDTMVFDGFRDFPLSEGVNHVEVWLSDINGSEAVSNTRTSSFANSVQATNAVQMKLYTDKRPEETTWRLYNSAGDIVREGGPYDGQARKFITVDFNLTADDCYLLEFLDAGADGIKGANGNGYYQLFCVSADGKSTRIAQGDYEGAVHDVYFRLNNAAADGIGEVRNEQAVNGKWPNRKSFGLSGRPATERTRLRVYKNKKVTAPQ